MGFRRGLQIAAAATLVTMLASLAQLGAQQPPRDLKALARQSLAKIDGDLNVSGLKEPVEVVRDRWGVPHIYARNVDDLFFAQGYVIAQDRLWQLEWWRRQREGRLSEVLGPAAFERDRQARLLMYRGPFDDTEWTSYHPEGKRIFNAFAAGLNAFIAENANNLPVEFKLDRHQAARAGRLKPWRSAPRTSATRPANCSWRASWRRSARRSQPPADAGSVGRARRPRRTRRGVDRRERDRRDSRRPWQPADASHRRRL